MINNDKVLVLGYGRLGQEIVKQTYWNFLSRQFHRSFDFTDFDTYWPYLEGYNTLINCIGCTRTYDTNKEDHWNVNYLGILPLVNFCNNEFVNLIHISTDYLYSGSIENAKENDLCVPLPTWYGYTKLISDAHIEGNCCNYLTIRTSFKPNPYPYERVPYQVGNFDYVSVIANLIIKLVRYEAKGIFNVGTEKKLLSDLAKQTKPDINVMSKEEKIHPLMPENVSMNLDKMDNFLKEKESNG
jgi:dTDP-4-dehydrorhamnose reductase